MAGMKTSVTCRECHCLQSCDEGQQESTQTGDQPRGFKALTRTWWLIGMSEGLGWHRNPVPLLGSVGKRTWWRMENSGEGKPRERQKDSLSSGPRRTQQRLKLFSRSKASFHSLPSHAASRQGRRGKAQATSWTQCHQREGTSAQLQSHLLKDGGMQSLQELKARDAHGNGTLHQGMEVGGTLSP